jgi:hypothetical protein
MAQAGGSSLLPIVTDPRILTAVHQGMHNQNGNEKLLSTAKYTLGVYFFHSIHKFSTFLLLLLPICSLFYCIFRLLKDFANKPPSEIYLQYMAYATVFSFELIQ